jgi:hypothetical protein
LAKEPFEGVTRPLNGVLNFVGEILQRTNGNAVISHTTQTTPHHHTTSHHVMVSKRKGEVKGDKNREKKRKEENKKKERKKQRKKETDKEEGRGRVYLSSGGSREEP